jgi:hypothetical protein
MSPADRPMHALSTVLDLNDREAAARLASGHKVGSFNPYGNGQYSFSGYSSTTDTSKSVSQIRTPPEHVPGTFNPYGNGQTDTITFFRPTIRSMPNGTYEATSTVLFSDRSPQAIFGEGIDEDTCFEDWKNNASEKLDAWLPVTKLGLFLKEFRKLPEPPKDSPLHALWADENNLHIFDFIKVGGFNPYGNGQTSRPMSKDDYFKRNAKTFSSLTKAQRELKYKKYKANLSMTTTKQGNHNRVAMTTKQARTVTNSQIGATKKHLPPRVRTNPLMAISECSRYYYAALVCPFWWVDAACDSKIKGLKLPTEDKEAPCIPMTPNIKTRKFNSFARGSFGTNAAGIAAISMAPRRITNTTVNGWASNAVLVQSGIYAGGANFDSLLEDTSVLLSPGVTGFPMNTDYSNSQLGIVSGRGIKYRVVGAGLRVRFSGKEVDRGGTLHCVVHPDHDSLGGLSFGSIGQYETYFRVPATRNWTTITHTPVFESDNNFLPDYMTNLGLYTTYLSTETQFHYMGFMITDNVGGAWEWEAIIHYEAIGATVRGLTPTPVDMPGVSAVLTAATPQALAGINKDNSSGIPELLKEGVDMVSGLVNSDLGNMVKTVATIL